MNPRTRVFYYYVAFVVLYIVLNLLDPPNQAVLQQFHLTNAGARLVSVSVELPLILIWFAAFYGIAKLSHYAHLIKRNKDGRSVQTVALGMTFLALWLPISSNLSALIHLWTSHHHGFASTGVMVGDYVSLLVPLTGFVILAIGARGLTDHIKQRPSRLAVQGLTLFLVIIGVMYCYFTFTNNHLRSVYQIPNWLLIPTFIVPYIFMWITGILTTSEFYVYSRKVPGVIYRQSWKLLAVGLSLVVSASIAVQYLTTLTNKLTHLRIGALLLIVYLLLITVAGGYVLIALGAKKLQRIEEV